MKNKEKVKKMGLIFLYAFLSASGLILLKIGTEKDLSFRISGGVFDLKVNMWIIAGMIVYICSFLFSLVVMSMTDLSVFYPISAGLVYIIVCLAGYFILKETMTVSRFVGMVVILAGVVIINIGRH